MQFFVVHVVIIHSWTIQLQWIILSLNFWIEGQSNGSRRKAEELVESEKGTVAYMHETFLVLMPVNLPIVLLAHI